MVLVTRDMAGVCHLYTYFVLRVPLCPSHEVGKPFNWFYEEKDNPVVICAFRSQHCCKVTVAAAGQLQ